MQRTTCPFCNAAVIETSALPRVLCPRCGEAFAPSAWNETADLAPSVPAAVASKFPHKAFAISLVISLAAVAAALAWFQPWQTPTPAVTATTEVATIPAAALNGLSHLPSGVNIVVAIQPAAMLRFHDGPQDSRDIYNSFGLPAALVGTLLNAGIEPRQVEQIVAGITFAPDRLIPGLTVVLKLRSPVNEDMLLQALQAERKPLAGRPVYVSKSTNLLAAKLDDRTWLLGLTDTDLTHKPQTGLDHLPAVVQTGIRGLDPASYAWAVTDQRDWSAASPIFKVEAGKAIAAKLAKVRGASAAFSFDRGPLTKVVLEFADPTTAKAVNESLKNQLPADAVRSVKESAVQVEVRQAPEESIRRIRALIAAAMK